MHDESSSTAFGGVSFVGFPDVGSIAVDIPAVLVMHCIEFKQPVKPCFLTMAWFYVSVSSGWGPSVNPWRWPVGLVTEFTFSWEVGL